MVIFRRNESALLRKVEFKPVYDNVIKEYLDLGHMHPVSAPILGDNEVFYLPHHPVLKPESTTTKVRVVFNASHSSSNGRSLNDVLYPGPALQTDLTILLLQWRLYRFVFSSDITKMYRQILVSPDQTRFQRILFRESPQQPVQDFQLDTVTFGVNCAPFLAIRTLLQLARDVEHTFPLASVLLQRNMYVDDVLAGFDDLSKALNARNQFISALSSAGFELRKWTANHKDLLSDLPSSHLLCEDFLNFEEHSSSKALGVRWNASRDDFYFTTESIEWKDAFTKREVLSIVARIFDPAGWLAPVVISAKILMQQVWQDGTEWDENLQPHSLAKFQKVVHASADLSQRQYAHQSLEWDFIPAGAPHMGGLCEAGVKSFKAHFKKVAANFKYTLEEMSTLLCRIEACLNSRPLCVNSDNTADEPSITPAHLLGGFALMSPAEEVVTDQAASIVNRWRRLKALSHSFALLWKEEYLKELHKRNKWRHPMKNFEIGDVVVIRHENLPPTEWRFGRVELVHPGTDQRERVPTIHTLKGKVTRPITKLVLLPKFFLFLQMDNAEDVSRAQSPTLSIDVVSLGGLFDEPVAPLTSVPPVGTLNPRFNCAVCKKQHQLRFCRRFQRLDLEHRLRAVVKFGYCMRCLSSRHVTGKCASKINCVKCQGSYHFLLHDDDSPRKRPRRNRNAQPLKLTSASLRNSVHPIDHRVPSSKMIFPTCQIMMWIRGQPIVIRALLDQCSGMNLILHQLPHSFKLPASEGQDVELVISPLNKSERMSIVARVTKTLRQSSTVPCSPIVRAHFENLRLADPDFDQPGPIHMVLGLPVYNAIMRLNVLSQPGFPQAQDSIFGWVLSGMANL